MEPIQLKSPMAIKLSVRCNSWKEMMRVQNGLNKEVRNSSSRDDIFVIASPLFQVLRAPYVKPHIMDELKDTLMWDIMNSYTVLLIAPEDMEMPHISIGRLDECLSTE